MGKSDFLAAFAGRPTSQQSGEKTRRLRSGAQVELGTVDTPAGAQEMAIWDILCADGGFVLETPYLAGTQGCVVVCDRTRRPTITASRALISRLEEAFPGVACVLAMNKSDLADRAEVSAEDINDMRAQGLSVIETSSSSGDNVRRCFEELALLVTQGG